MLIVYDFEVFKYDWLVVFINLVDNKTTTISNNRDELKEFYEKNKGSIFVGYNSRHYDQYIFKGILLEIDPHELSKFIIEEGKFGWEYSNKLNKIELINFDIKMSLKSLKEYEGYFGNNIMESSVDFTIDRKLTDDEIKETEKYCIHDVEQTVEVLTLQKTELMAIIKLVQMFALPKSYVSKTKANLASIILGSQKEFRNDEFNLKFCDTIKLDKYKYVLNWYDQNREYDKKLETEIDGVPTIFAWGGCHGAIEHIKEEGIIVNCDITSYYPQLMIEYDFLSRNVKNKELFREIRDKRLEYKRTKQKEYANVLKIVINATYGASKSKTNNLYDPLMANNVCVNGQLFLLDLIEKLEGYWKPIQYNTDGLIGKVDNLEQLDKIKEIAKEWEDRTKFELEWDVYNKIYQKDVNNYIIIGDDIKSKGSFKKPSKLDYNLPIIKKAVLEYCINNVDVRHTIEKSNDLIEFQRIVKISSKFSHIEHGGKYIKEKCIRVFASKDTNDGGIIKYKEGRPHKLEGTPEHCFIYNENVNGVKIPNKLDKEWYIQKATEYVESFEGG